MPGQVRVVLLEEVEQDGGGGEAEGDVVGQRIEFLADGRGDVQQAGRHPVEEVEHGADDDKQQGGVVDPAERPVGGDAARDEVAAGDRVWDMLLDAHLNHLCNNGLVAGRRLSDGDAGLCCQGQEHVDART